jgi:hypothetical protein
MTDQTRTDQGTAGPPAQPARKLTRPGDGILAAGLGLLLGLLALGPGLLPGYLLSYDMVFVPRPQFNAVVLGTSGALPRAVPSDAVMAALARALPADLVQKLVLLAIFVLACAGAARLLSGHKLPAQLAAGALYAWNPFIAERLILGQWALLLGYAGLPWVLAAASRQVPGAGWRPLARQALRLMVALVPAAIGGFAAMSVSALIALPAAALRPGRLQARLAAAGLTLAVLAVLSLPWLIPSLTRHVLTSPAGVAAFAARADTPFGTAGSLVMLGGAWNAQTVPSGYSGAATVPWLCLIVVALAGFAALGRWRWPGLTVAAAAGLLIALAGSLPAGQSLLRTLISSWAGFAVLRDGQQFVAPLALAEAAGLGLAVSWVLRLTRPRLLRDGRTVLAVALIVAPLLFLPGLAAGAAGRLRPVQYPADWLAARRLINSDPQPGSALLLPWGSYRRYGWNHGEAVLDPWPRLLSRPVVYNDAVQVGSLSVPSEDPAAIAINGAISSGGPLTSALKAGGYRYVLVDGAPAGPVSARLPGCITVLSGPGLIVFRVPG